MESDHLDEPDVLNTDSSFNQQYSHSLYVKVPDNMSLHWCKQLKTLFIEISFALKV